MQIGIELSADNDSRECAVSQCHRLLCSVCRAAEDKILPFNPNTLDGVYYVRKLNRIADGFFFT